jgi:hypothetical protein
VALVSGAVATQKPKTVKGTNRKDPQYVRYTPSNQLGDKTKLNDKILWSHQNSNIRRFLEDLRLLLPRSCIRRPGNSP